MAHKGRQRDAEDDKKGEAADEPAVNQDARIEFACFRKKMATAKAAKTRVQAPRCDRSGRKIGGRGRIIAVRRLDEEDGKDGAGQERMR